MKKRLLIIIFILVITGCGNKNLLLGDWYLVEDDETYTFSFKEDQICEMQNETGNDIENCTYETDDNILKIKIKDREEIIKIKYEVTDEYLELSGASTFKLYKSLEEAKKSAKKNLIEVPDVFGLELEQAKVILESEGFGIRTPVGEYNDDLEEGLVIETSPKKGRKTKPGTEIVIIYSLGKQKVKIEDYTGQNYLAVKANLEHLGINVNVERKAVNSSFSEEIIDQSIKEGAILTKGDSITLYIGE